MALTAPGHTTFRRHAPSAPRLTWNRGRSPRNYVATLGIVGVEMRIPYTVHVQGPCGSFSGWTMLI